MFALNPMFVSQDPGEGRSWNCGGFSCEKQEFLIPKLWETRASRKKANYSQTILPSQLSSRQKILDNKDASLLGTRKLQSFKLYILQK